MCYTRRIRRHVQHQENIVQFLKNLIPVVTRVLVSFLEFKSSSLHVLYMFRTEENKKMKPSQGKIRISLKVPNFFFFFGEPGGLGSALDQHSPCLLQCKLKKKNHYYFWSKSKFPTRVFFFFRILSILTYTHGERGKCFLKKLTEVYIQNGLTLKYTIQALNLFNSHSFSNVRLIHCFFF